VNFIIRTIHQPDCLSTERVSITEFQEFLKEQAGNPKNAIRGAVA
jgi:hypothetical protein